MRTKLIQKLAYELRHAENKYLDSDLSDDSAKNKVYSKVDKSNFTHEEKREFEELCNSMGI